MRMEAWRRGMWKDMLTRPDCRYARALPPGAAQNRVPASKQCCDEEADNYSAIAIVAEYIDFQIHLRHLLAHFHLEIV